VLIGEIYLENDYKRYSGNRMLRTRIPSRRIPKNALPETNIAIDTSASMSFAELEVIISEIQAAVQIAEIKKVNVILWTGSAYWDKSYNKVDPETFDEIKKDIADNWRSGGTTVRSVYEKLKEKGWTKKFTIIFTDGYTENHGSSLMNLVSEVLDLNNTLWGIIQPGTGITVSQWESITDDKPGEVVPIFLDRSLFNQGR
jgi:predicted metal-dependent peptidase